MHKLSGLGLFAGCGLRVAGYRGATAVALDLLYANVYRVVARFAMHSHTKGLIEFSHSGIAGKHRLKVTSIVEVMKAGEGTARIPSTCRYLGCGTRNGVLIGIVSAPVLALLIYNCS